jgi:HD-GYP domain-containing protein (c-di-GMP phosphodiesterase class II)
MGLMRSMIALVELKDTYTKNHSESVGHYSMVLGQMLGFPAARLQSLNIAAQLHDVGKIGIVDEVLKKEGPLSNEEYAIMKQHAGFGEKVLQPIQSLKHEAFIIGRHHEHMDGKGYPYQAVMEHIPIEARIIGIADAYHAMISHRPYRRGLGVDEAIRRLQEGKGKQFDPKLVDLFVEYARNPGRHTYRFRPFCLVH